MTAVVLVTPAAEADIAEAFDWYLSISPTFAERFLDQMERAFLRLAEWPRMSARAHGEARRAALKTFPYYVWFVYDEEADAVQVVSVSHQRRDPDGVRRRLP